MSAHDDRRPLDDDLDDAERALASRLATVLLDRAKDLAIAEVAFDPSRRTTLDLGDGAVATGSPVAPLQAATTDPSGTLGAALEPDPLDPLPIGPSDRADRRWIVWVAGAVAAAILVAAIVMIKEAEQPSVEVVDDPALVVDDDTAWQPTWVPDGMELWRLQVERIAPEEVRSVDPNPRAETPPVAQLVMSSDGRTRLLVSIGGSADFNVSGGTTTSATIRGIEGTSRPVQGGFQGTQLGWEESGQGFTAFIVEAEPGAAIAVLDRLGLSDPSDPAAGFAAPDDGSVTVLTDDQRGTRQVLPIGARFDYASERPVGDDADLTVATMGPSSGLSATSVGYPGYLASGFIGEIRPDGVAFVYRPAVNGNPASAQAVWPDARSVYVFGPDLDQATAERIVLGVEPVPLDQLEQRVVEVSDRIGSGPVLARADLPSGTVEVVGEPGPVALCLTVAGQRRCSLSDRLAGMGGKDPGPAQMASGSLLIDGRWYLFGANEGPVDVTVELGGGGSGTTTGTGPPDPAVPAERATIGTWTVALLVVPDGWDRATVTFPNRSSSLHRPAS